jgi:hypothetical protein
MKGNFFGGGGGEAETALVTLEGIEGGLSEAVLGLLVVRSGVGGGDEVGIEEGGFSATS